MLGKPSDVRAFAFWVEGLRGYGGDKDLGNRRFRAHGQCHRLRAGFHRVRRYPYAVDPRAKVVEIDARVDVRGQARVGVPKDALRDHDRHPGAREQRSRRAPEVVEPERAVLRLRPKAEAALRAGARTVVGLGFLEAAALPAALVDVAGDEARAGERAAQDVLQRHLRGVHCAIGAREHEV